MNTAPPDAGEDAAAESPAAIEPDDNDLMTDAVVALRDAAVEENRAGLCAEGLFDPPPENPRPAA